MAAILVGSGAVAGALGAMFGIGGGVLLVPILVLALGVPMEDAVPASLMCVVANSCAAAAHYVEARLSDVRLALTLELATVAGAIGGGLLAGRIPPAVVAFAFGLFAVYVAGQMVFSRREQLAPAGPIAPVNVPLGMSGSFVAGGLSAVLGVGGGPLKVPLMSLGMRVPFKVATATSNLMIGVTGAASVAAYAWRGHLKLSLCAPLVVGVLLGARLGSRWMVRMPVGALKRLFALVLLAIAVEMLWKGGSGLWRSG